MKQPIILLCLLLLAVSAQAAIEIEEKTTTNYNYKVITTDVDHYLASIEITEHGDDLYIDYVEKIRIDNTTKKEKVLTGDKKKEMGDFPVYLQKHGKTKQLLKKQNYYTENKINGRVVLKKSEAAKARITLGAASTVIEIDESESEITIINTGKFSLLMPADADATADDNYANNMTDLVDSFTFNDDTAWHLEQIFASNNGATDGNNMWFVTEGNGYVVTNMSAECDARSWMRNEFFADSYYYRQEFKNIGCGHSGTGAVTATWWWTDSDKITFNSSVMGVFAHPAKAYTDGTYDQWFCTISDTYSDSQMCVAWNNTDSTSDNALTFSQGSPNTVALGVGNLLNSTQFWWAILRAGQNEGANRQTLAHMWYNQTVKNPPTYTLTNQSDYNLTIDITTTAPLNGYNWVINGLTAYNVTNVTAHYDDVILWNSSLDGSLGFYMSWNVSGDSTHEITLETNGGAPPPLPAWIQTPANQIVEYDNDLNYVVNATENGVDLDTIYINDTTNFNISVNETAGVGVKSVAATISKVDFSLNDEYSLTITVNDTDGSETSKVISIKSLDRTPPAWGVTPTNQTFFTSATTYSVNATDPQGISEYSLNDTSNFTIHNETGVINVSGANANIQHSLTISVNDTEGNLQNATIYIIYVEDPVFNCSTGDYAIHFIFRNESTLGNMSADVDDVVIQLLSPHAENISFTTNDIGNFSFCIYPTAETYTANIEVKYSETDYVTRWHFYEDYLISNTTDTIYLYNLLDSLDTATTLTLLDQSGDLFGGIIVEAWKRIEGNYTLVEIGKSDSDGEYIYSLEHNNIYNFIIMRGNTAIQVENNLLIDSASLTIQVSPAAIIGDFDIAGKYTVSCVNITETMLAQCTISQVGNDALFYRMITWTKYNRTSPFVERCRNDSVDGSTITFKCDVSDYVIPGNGTVVIRIWAKEAEISPEIATKIYEFFRETVYDNEGILYAMMIILLFTGIGLLLRSVPALLIMLILGVVSTSYLGLMNISQTMVSAIIILALIGLVAVLK